MGRLITRDDVIRGGACSEGVYDWANDHANGLTAIPLSAALKLADDDDREHILRAVGFIGEVGDGYGNGNGNGAGNGNGNGNGNGDGDGYGNGNGAGNGGYGQ